MKKNTILTLLAATLLPLAAAGQEQAQAPALSAADATALFQRIDQNKDQQLSAAEARPHGISATQLSNFDHDGDAKINASEFLVAYKQLAEANGSTITRDLAKQVLRIQTAQRIATEEAAKAKLKRAQEARRTEAAKPQGQIRQRAQEQAIQRAEAKRKLEAAQAKRKQEAAESKRKEEAAQAKRIQEAAKADQASRRAAQKRAEAERKKKQQRPEKRPRSKRQSRRNG